MDREPILRNLQHQHRWGVRHRIVMPSAQPAYDAARGGEGTAESQPGPAASGVSTGVDAAQAASEGAIGAGRAPLDQSASAGAHDSEPGDAAAESMVGAEVGTALEDAGAGIAPAPPPGRDGDERRRVERALDELRAEVAACTLCRTLVEHRTQTVLSDGTPHTPLMFVGEAPGADEDRQGVPFVGRAGELLTQIIERGMGVPRSAVYIANVLKCRPPRNRDPEPDEVHNCTGYLIRQIELVRPRVVVALGRPAAQFLLDTDAGIGQLRGRLHDAMWGDVSLKVMPTYHPAFVLRQYTTENRQRVWADVTKALDYLKDLGEHPWW